MTLTGCAGVGKSSLALALAERVKQWKEYGPMFLTDARVARGVVTASAGNHAQGLALAAKVLGVKATIVMPKTTPEIKIEAGTFDWRIDLEDVHMNIEARLTDRIGVTAIRNPAELPWAALKVDVVFECTGLFTLRAPEKTATFQGFTMPWQAWGARGRVFESLRPDHIFQ